MAANEAKIRLTAEDITAAAFASVVKNVGSLKTELATLPAKFTQIAIATAGLSSIAGFASMIQESIEAKARLKDLSLQSNISVEALSSLSKVGKYSSTSIEEIASASTKLSKALFTQNEDSKGAAAAIQALGLNFDKFKSLTPDQQMYEVAKALDQFQDGSEKSAAAMLLFGKQGAQLLPFLKELSERGLEAARVTTQQAEEAKKYEDNLVALKSAGEEWKKTLAGDMLPALLEFSRELVAGRQAYGGWFSAIVNLGTTNPFSDMGENITKARDDVKSLQDELAKSQNSKFSLSRPTALIQSELDSALKRYDYFKRIQAAQALDMANGVYEDPRTRIPKPTLKLPTANQNPDSADSLLRRIFQGQLKASKDQLDQEKELAEFRNKVLKGEYDDGLRSLTDFYAKQGQIRADGLAAELAAIDKEIAAATDLKAKAEKPETRQQAENAIREAQARRALAVQKSAHENSLAIQEEQRAVKQLAFTYFDFLGNVANLKGDAAGASALRIAKQVQDAQEMLRKVGFGPEEVQARAGAFKILLEQTDALSRAQADYNRLMESLGVVEKGLALDAQLNGATELETLRAVGVERQRQLPLMQELVDRAVAEAKAIGSPEALLAAQRLQLAFRQAVAEADPVYTRLREIGKEAAESVANDAEQAILHWEGFRKLLGAIEQDILRIATRKLFTEPFGNFLTNQIGGNGTASGRGGILGGFLGNLFNPGASTPQSLDSGVFGLMKDLGVASMDVGTNYVPQDMLALVHKGEEIVPAKYNDAEHRGMTFAPAFNFNGPVDRRTQDQVAAAAFAGAQRALRRNG